MSMTEPIEAPAAAGATPGTAEPPASQGGPWRTEGPATGTGRAGPWATETSTSGARAGAYAVDGADAGEVLARLNWRWAPYDLLSFWTLAIPALAVAGLLQVLQSVGITLDEVADDLDAAVERQLSLILKAAPHVSADAKRLVRTVAATTDRDRLDHDNAALIARLRVSPEGQEGLGAFLDKRRPEWVE